MAPTNRRASPRNYFLNEAHELSPVERTGGGRLAEYVEIAWAGKARHISQSLRKVNEVVQASRDPLKEERYFVLAAPVKDVTKRSKDKKKAPEGIYTEKTEFGGQHASVFDRLGLDLLQVTEDGRAVVHAQKDRFDQLLTRSASLGDLGRREQARWVTIDSFETIPVQLRVDSDWLRGLPSGAPTDVVFELQPVLTTVEADRVLRSLADLLGSREGEKLTGTGTDFSGRHWFRGRASPQSVRAVARDYFSVQAIHSPLYSIAAASSSQKGRARSQATAEPLTVRGEDLPCVAVVDLGIPSDHKQLKPYRRGQFVPQAAPSAPVGDHGTFVASRVVFGACDNGDDLLAATPSCAFYDGRVGDYPDGSGRADLVNDKIVMEAVRGVRSAAPDVRVFNLSFGDARPLDAFNLVEKREKRLALQDLDNFVFGSDTIVVVAAGNSPPGTSPTPDYPEHHQDTRWALGPWACGFNTLICGSFVSRISPRGLVKTIGWPSPFSRIGPGLCGAPIPSFSAEGGNTDDAFRVPHGLGVWGLSGRGLAEDRTGTSHAAPLLAREAALALDELTKYCAPGTQPFAVTARAFLALAADPPVGDPKTQALVARTLGFGSASVKRLTSPTSGSAVVLWQGIIESANDKVRVQFPIPLTWLEQAEDPVLRLALCYDPPVNEAAQATWACRRVKAVLYLGPDGTWLRATGRHGSYPLSRTEYRLANHKPGAAKPAEGDMWLVELSYDEIAPYPAGMDFDPRQRVAFVGELFDRAEDPVDPQPAMQALPIATTMTRLSVQTAALRSPVILRTR